MEKDTHPPLIRANVAQVSHSTSESIKRKIFDFEDYLFEKKYSLELSGIVENKNLVANNKESLSHTTGYQAVWSRNLRELFNEAQKTGYEFENFIDIGSGKGKACFYAYTKRIFNNIIGIEFSEPLVEIANRNKVKIKSPTISFINADATEFELPKQNNLIFMFNPFDSVVLEKFISNNIEHFRKNNSVIAYANDTQRLSLTKFGFETIFRNQSRKISLYQLT
jgi:SAM-dependent methyltransferase